MALPLRETELIDSQTILRPTHQVSNSPSSDSWSALLASFAESAATMAGGAENAMSLWGSTLLAEAHDVASAVQLWLSPDSERDLDWMDVAASHDSGALVKLQREVGHINEHLDNLASAEAAQSEFQALRLQALSDIKQAHGVTGEEYKQALHLVKATIHSAVERMHQVAKNRGQEARIALILSSNNPQAHESLYQKRNSASIGSLLLPFGKRVTNAAEQRAFKFGEVASSLGAPSFEGPSFSPQSVDATLLNPKDYQGKCFTSAEALYNATASCSGHGTAVQKIRATKRCFRCQCKATRTSNSKTSWAGDACEKVDLSNQTLLFLGTAAGLIFLTAATIQFMLKEGDLPLSGTLASVSVPTYKL